MKTIEVVAAIIINENKVFATQRGYGEYKDYWEFPGGKIEQGESKENALIREIKEELDTTINIKHHLITVEHDYPNFHLIMHCFVCDIVKGNLTLLEHEDSKWLTNKELNSVNWLPADDEVIRKISDNNLLD